MGRQVNPEVVSYMRAVDAIVEDRTGVKVTQLSTDYQFDGAGIGKAAEGSLASGVAPEDFATDLATKMNLLPRGEFADVEEARAVNLRRASLVTFARENAGWKLGARDFAGSAFRDSEQGQVIRMDVAQSKAGGAWGYAISVAEDAHLVAGVATMPGLDAAADRVIIAPHDAWFEHVAGGQDIDVAIAGYNKRVEETYVPAPGM